MEPQSQQQQLASDHHNGKAVQSNYLCRQSSTRWTPTTDQIKILKDLYYKEGVRSPNADQIQKISAQLRQFGKIEGKNVFYWFQNHKARERQKKKFTSLNSNPAHAIRYPNFTPGISCPSSSAGGMVSVGHCGYGHMSMENNYLKECGVAAYGNGGLYSYPSQSFQWSNGMNPYTLMENARNPNQVQFLDDQDQEKAPELETLPLFPIHAEDSSVGSFNGGTNVMRSTEPDNNNNCYNNTSSCHWLNPQTTLELSLNLNSYGDHQWPNY